MKTKRSLHVTSLICVLALVSAAYCFWLMTVPLSYDLVVPVLIGFALSVLVFVIGLISSIIIAFRLRKSHAARSAQITPTV